MDWPGTGPRVDALRAGTLRPSESGAGATANDLHPPGDVALTRRQPELLTLISRKLACRWCAGASPRHPQRQARFRGWGFHPTLGQGECSAPLHPPGLTPPQGAGLRPAVKAVDATRSSETVVKQRGMEGKEQATEGCHGLLVVRTLTTVCSSR